MDRKQGFISGLERLIGITLSVIFLMTSVAVPVTSGHDHELPKLGTLVNPTPAHRPMLFQGIEIHPNNPLKISFLFDPGEERDSSNFKDQADRLIRYFLAALTVPKSEMWVNLSPFEQNRIMSENLGATAMGQDLLAQDYLLKQLTSSLLHPDSEYGRKFWSKVHALVYEKYGSVDMPVDTYNKVWIVPESADVVEHETGARIRDGQLNVMLERDYIAMTRGQTTVSNVTEEQLESGHNIQQEALREIIIPAIKREVNEGQTFAPLRQMFHAMILATWYKRSLSRSLLGQQYADQNRVADLSSGTSNQTRQIYEQYVASYRRGVYNFVREDYHTSTDSTVTRQYFSGGISTDKLELKVAADRQRYVETDLAMVSVYLNDGSPFSQAMLSREDRLAESLRLRHESMGELKEAFGRFFPHIDFGSMGIFQGFVESFFIPWSEGYRQAERQIRDSLVAPYLSQIEAMGEVSSAMAFMNPMWGMQQQIWRPITEQARKMRKTIDYVKSIENETPESFSPGTTILRVPGLFYLTKIESLEGQTVNPDLPPALIITPHSGHDGRSLADYTNKDRTGSNSLAQTFKNRGYETYILVWESSRELLDIGDLQEAVHLSVRTIGQKVVIGGLCHGGAVGAHYMGVMPDNVAGLILAGAPVNTHVGDNDVTQAAQMDMSIYNWLQFGHGVPDVYPGLAQLHAFKHLGFNGGYDKRVTAWKRLVENIDDIDYVERDRIFRIWFENVNNIGYFVDWIDQVFKRNRFVFGDLTFRLGQKKFRSSPANFRPDVPIATIEGAADDITPPPTITIDEMAEVSDDPQGLWAFLTHGIVSRERLGDQELDGQPLFDYLSDNGYIDIRQTGDVNYGYVNQSRLVPALNEYAKKLNAFRFAVGDFQDRDDTAESVLPKIQLLIDAVAAQSGLPEFSATHYAEALRWLNADISLYGVLDRDELRNLDGQLVEAIESELSAPLDQLDNEQLTALNQTFEGIKLKRLIAMQVFPEAAPDTVRRADAEYVLDIGYKNLKMLERAWHHRLFSDSDEKSVNSTPGQLAVMRQPFADMAFERDFERFRSIDAPFIRYADPDKLRDSFEKLSALRGQSSDVFSIVPTDKDLQQLKLVHGGHIGIYNGSRSQRAWRDILAIFERQWKDQGRSGFKLPEDDDLILAVEDKVVYFDEAMLTERDRPAEVSSEKVGGIDFNSDFMQMNISREDSGVIIPRFNGPTPAIDFDHLSPVILNLTAAEMPLSNPTNRP